MYSHVCDALGWPHAPPCQAVDDVFSHPLRSTPLFARHSLEGMDRNPVVPQRVYDSILQRRVVVRNVPRGVEWSELFQHFG